MLKNKKIFLGALSLTTLAVPLVSAVSCGSNNSGGSNSMFDRVREIINLHSDLASEANSTTLDFENDVFQSIATFKLSDTAFGLIYPLGALPVIRGFRIIPSFFVLEVDTSKPSVKMQATFTNDSTIEDPDFYSSTSFFTITNFNARFDLSTFNSITPFASDQNLVFGDPAQANATEITTALNNIIKDYVNAQMPNASPKDNYTITELLTVDGKAIANDNLKENARSYTAVLTAKDKDAYVKNKVKITINLPKMDVLDVSNLAPTYTSKKEDWVVTDPHDVSSNYVMEVLNKQIIEMIKQTRPNVTWNDLYGIYMLTDRTVMPHRFDLTISNQQIKLDLSALPYNNHAIGNNEITINLPYF